MWHLIYFSRRKMFWMQKQRNEIDSMVAFFSSLLLWLRCSAKLSRSNQRHSYWMQDVKDLLAMCVFSSSSWCCIRCVSSTFTLWALNETKALSNNTLSAVGAHPMYLCAWQFFASGFFYGSLDLVCTLVVDSIARVAPFHYSTFRFHFLL